MALVCAYRSRAGMSWCSLQMGPRAGPLGCLRHEGACQTLPWHCMWEGLTAAQVDLLLGEPGKQRAGEKAAELDSSAVLPAGCVSCRVTIC